MLSLSIRVRLMVPCPVVVLARGCMIAVAAVTEEHHRLGEGEGRVSRVQTTLSKKRKRKDVQEMKGGIWRVRRADMRQILVEECTQVQYLRFAATDIPALSHSGVLLGGVRVATVPSLWLSHTIHSEHALQGILCSLISAICAGGGAYRGKGPASRSQFCQTVSPRPSLL